MAEQVVGFTPQQFRNYISAQQKLPKFDGKDAYKFQTWRQNAEIDLNDWDLGARASRLKIRQAMVDAAAEAVQDIALHLDAVPVPPYVELLDAYQRIWLPDTATDFAAAIFSSSKQAEGERLQAWHTRCRLLFKRAFPNRNNILTDLQLIAHFKANIYNDTLRRKVCDAPIADYNDAMTHAHRLMTGMQLADGNSILLAEIPSASTSAVGTSAADASSINAIGGQAMPMFLNREPRPDEPYCSWCWGIAHRKNQCHFRFLSRPPRGDTRLMTNRSTIDNAFDGSQPVFRQPSPFRGRGGRGGRGRGAPSARGSNGKWQNNTNRAKPYSGNRINSIDGHNASADQQTFDQTADNADATHDDTSADDAAVYDAEPSYIGPGN